MRARDNSLFVSVSLHWFFDLYHNRYNLAEKRRRRWCETKKHLVFDVMNGKCIWFDANCLILSHTHVITTVRF
mgnify:CR=1 FL=1